MTAFAAIGLIWTCYGGIRLIGFLFECREMCLGTPNPLIGHKVPPDDIDRLLQTPIPPK